MCVKGFLRSVIDQQFRDRHCTSGIREGTSSERLVALPPDVRASVARRASKIVITPVGKYILQGDTPSKTLNTALQAFEFARIGLGMGALSLASSACRMGVLFVFRAQRSAQNTRRGGTPGFASGPHAQGLGRRAL